MADKEKNTRSIISIIRRSGIDTFGIADLRGIASAELPLRIDFHDIYKNYQYAIVAGIPFAKHEASVPSTTLILDLEKTAYEISDFCEENRRNYLIIHPEDEFDPVTRRGLFSLKVLAKHAGIGWQGRSLLVVSPESGPIHRMIAVLTNMELIPNRMVESRCGDCVECIKKCPGGALKFKDTIDETSEREEILDIEKCLGDEGCTVCLKVCHRTRSAKR